MSVRQLLQQERRASRSNILRYIYFSCDNSLDRPPDSIKSQVVSQEILVVVVTEVVEEVWYAAIGAVGKQVDRELAWKVGKIYCYTQRVRGSDFRGDFFFSNHSSPPSPKAAITIHRYSIRRINQGNDKKSIYMQIRLTIRQCQIKRKKSPEK